jgi:hypothetical protein
MSGLLLRMVVSVIIIIIIITLLSYYECSRAGPTTLTARLSPRYKDKTRGCHYSHWVPDDGRKNARNMLSYK